MVYLEIFLTFLSNARLGDGNWNISEQGVGGGGRGEQVQKYLADFLVTSFFYFS